MNFELRSIYRLWSFLTSYAQRILGNSGSTGDQSRTKSPPSFGLFVFVSGNIMTLDREDFPPVLSKCWSVSTGTGKIPHLKDTEAVSLLALLLKAMW